MIGVAVVVPGSLLSTLYYSPGADMMRIIDLTRPITNGMQVFPGDPEVTFTPALTIAKDDYNVTQVCMGTHTGTHVDVSRHVIPDSHGVDSIPLDKLIGWAEVLDLGELKPGSNIVSADLNLFADRVTEGARVLLKTGWNAQWGQPDFYTDFPGLSEGAVAWLTARKVKLLGIEQPSVHTKNHLAIHKAILSAGIVLIESIANMDQLTQNRVYLVALPMKLAGLDGSPIRAAAIEGMDVSE